MRVTLICFTIVGVVLGSVVPVYAEETIYLPLITNGEKPPHFQIVSIRLWSPTENGRSPGSPNLCGENHVLQAHVFNECGDCGEASRLHGASVLVTHHSKEGNQTNETRQTGSQGSEVGIAQFELQRSAQIGIVTNDDGGIVTSDGASVSTVAAEIPVHHLISAGYCSDTTSCEQFIYNDSCNGYFSWNVVFKRVK